MENTCDNPTLDGLLYVDRRSTRPGWHIYKTYADMRGVGVFTMTDSPTRSTPSRRWTVCRHVAAARRKIWGLFERRNQSDHQNSRGKVVPVQGEDVHVCAERIPDVGSAPL